MHVFLASAFILLVSADCSANHAECPMVECQYYEGPGETGDVSTFMILVKPDWAPLGAARFLKLVREKYYDGSALYRAIQDFIVQFGLSADRSLREQYKGTAVPDDPDKRIPFMAGMMSFAGSKDPMGRGSRETQIFITLGDYVPHLGKDAWERPFGKVIFGLDRFKGSINYDSGDGAFGAGPAQPKIWQQGYKYLKHDFPNLSYLRSCYEIDLSIEAKRQYLEKEAGMTVTKPLYNPELMDIYDNNVPIKVEISNASGERLQVFWVNRNRQEVLNGEIDVDGKISLNSYSGHAFAVRSEKTRTLMHGFKVFPVIGKSMSVKVLPHKGEL